MRNLWACVRACSVPLFLDVRPTSDTPICPVGCNLRNKFALIWILIYTTFTLITVVYQQKTRCRCFKEELCTCKPANDAIGVRCEIADHEEHDKLKREDQDRLHD